MKRNTKKDTSCIAEKIKELRALSGWTQEDLSKRSGINRVTLASIETGKIKNPSTEIFLKLARAFGIVPEELYKAAGYIKDYEKPYDNKLTIEAILDTAKNALPLEIPVYPLELFADYGIDVPAHIEPIIYTYRPRPATVTGRVVGFVVDRDYLSPMISPTDIVILDSNSDINSGNIVACIIKGQPQIGRLLKSADKLFLENNFGRFPLDSHVPLVRVKRVNKLL